MNFQSLKTKALLKVIVYVQNKYNEVVAHVKLMKFAFR